jgi:hypothetical protein
MSFLGGFSFAGLVLVIGAKDTFDSTDVMGFTADAYFQLLLLVLGLVSSITLIGSIAMARVGAGSRFTDRLAGFAIYCYVGTVMGFILALFLILARFSPDDAWIVFITSSLAYGYYLALSVIGRSHESE